MTVQIRGFFERDLSFLVRLLNEAYREAYEFRPYTEDGLRSRLQEGKLEILMAEEKGEVLGSVAYSDGHWGEEIEWLAVSKGPSRTLLQNVLVAEIEEHVKRGTVFTVVDDASPEINEWIERGYRLEGGLYHMVARLDGSKPLPKVPEDVTLRSLRLEEEKALVQAVNAGFGWERLKVGIIQEWKNESALFTEEWVHVAEHQGRIVSVVASRPDAQYKEFFKGRRGYLGPATTLPEYRGKNLASALTRRAMNSLFEKGMDSVALYTQDQNTASVALLRKFDFRVEHHWKFMRKNFEHKTSEKHP
jgi:ribosomal protein S18 acetylase RimI-like enzyme